MTSPNLPEVVGLQEIADLLEVGKRTPHAWQYRRLLPPADFASINGLRAWRTGTILQWAANTGRLPSSLRGVVVADMDSDLPVVRGGRRAKQENLAALAAAGYTVPTAKPVEQPADFEFPVGDLDNLPPSGTMISADRL